MVVALAENLLYVPTSKSPYGGVCRFRILPSLLRKSRGPSRPVQEVVRML